MSLSVKYGGRVLAAARGGLTLSTPDRWLIGLRWVAIAGMAATVAGARWVVPSLRVAPLVAVLAAIALGNLGWTLVAWLRPEPRGLMVAAQIALDVAGCAAILWFSGGLENPFSRFLAFQIVLAGLLGSWRTIISISLLSFLATVILYFAPPLALDGAIWPAARVESISRLTAIVSLGAFLALFIMLFEYRLQKLRDEASRHEKLAGLGRTVAAMCHELNTPLGTVVLAGKDLEKIGRDGGNADVEELARTVTTSAERASNIIGLMRGSVSPAAHLERVELASFVTAHVRAELDRLGFRGQRHVAAPRPVDVVALPVALGQILTNLLTNAVDALAGEPQPRIEIAVEEGRDAVQVTIADNGPGVSASFLARVGEPFQTTKEAGTGLGLYVSAMLAERMGGSLELESRAGKGTRLCLRLQRASARERAA